MRDLRAFGRSVSEAPAQLNIHTKFLRALRKTERGAERCGFVNFRKRIEHA